MYEPFVYAITDKKAYTTLKALQKKITCSAYYVPGQNNPAQVPRPGVRVAVNFVQPMLASI
jgi:hypothetical protein